MGRSRGAERLRSMAVRFACVVVRMDWMVERSEFELPVPFLNSQTTALFYVCDARTKTAWPCLS
jgi:hypothetical protein